MDRWAGKTAIVTGASSGIGEEIVKSLVEHGVKVVGLARRFDKLEKLAKEIGRDNFYPIECDVTKEEDILRAFKWTEKELGGVDIMVNNAAIIIPEMVIESSTDVYRRVVDTNLIAPAICAREAIQCMKKRNVPGHVININSLAGHYAESIHFPLGLYACTKYGVTALGMELRHEIIAFKLNVKVTSISPGAVKTDMVTGVIDTEALKNIRILEPKDVAQAVIFALTTPQTVEIPELTILAQGEVIGTPSNRHLTSR